MDGKTVEPLEMKPLTLYPSETGPGFLNDQLLHLADSHYYKAKGDESGPVNFAVPGFHAVSTSGARRAEEANDKCLSGADREAGGQDV